MVPAMSAKKSVLFVCTGNTCRSPMAEGLFRKAVELFPAEGEYLAHLAWTRFLSSPDDNTARDEAVRGLRRAVRSGRLPLERVESALTRLQALSEGASTAPSDASPRNRIAPAKPALERR